ncbi:MAG: esterase family protein, partial [Lachnospiraceae bacterium]|nr:esterase family protein [Lachnospiraceae bacterium]
MKMKLTRKMALSALAALLISMTGCGDSASVRDIETAVEEDKTMTDLEIEIFCPEEYSKKNADIKYSDVIMTTYYSTTCEKDRPVNIVLPAGYSEGKEYPVLYVLHGIFGTQNDMNNNSITIQNMMTAGIAKDMIVVYPYMYASKISDKCTAIDKENVAAYDNFINDLVTDLMPFIKENYSIAEGRENTAIAGFSMGGRESLAIGLQRPDLFGYVGAIAPAPGLVPGKDWAMTHEGQFAEEELVFNDEKSILLM